MRRAALALLLLCALLPTAAAQTAGLFATTTTVHVKPLEAPLAPGDMRVVPVLVEYTYPAAGVATNPTTIDLEVTEGPAWGAASVSPSTVQAPVDMLVITGSGTKTSTVQAELVIAAGEDAPDGTTAVYKVSATAYENGNMGASHGETELLVMVNAPAPVNATADDEGATVQEASAAPSLGAVPGGALAVVGLAAMGAAGAVAWRRHNREA